MRFKYLILAIIPFMLINCEVFQVDVSVSIPPTITEENTILYDAGEITLDQDARGTLTVNLQMSSNGEGHLSIQDSVEISAGDTSATFDIEVIDIDQDEYNSGSVEITITASAGGYEDGSDTTTLYYQDNVP
jgi:hypothetical protein